MSAPESSDISTSLTGRHHRSARNYLLDPHFQLKYTGVLVAIAIVISLVLGVQLYRTSNVLIDQSRRTVEQGQETVQQGQETVKSGQALIEESRKVSAVVSMNIVKDPVYAENPELLAVFKENAAEQERKLNAQQARLEAEQVRLLASSRSLQEQAAGLASQQRNTLVVLFGGLSLLVIVIGFSGIVFTHKVAGPIYKMKGLLRRVAEGHYIVPRGLRKGDELQHFFDAFVRMLEALRARQTATIDRIETTIVVLEGKVDADKLAPLRELRRDMQASLDDGPT